MIDEPGQEVTARRATADVSIQLVGRAVSLLLGVVTTVLVVRTLGDERFGQWSTILAVVEIVGYLSGTYSLEQIAVERAAADRGRQREWLGAQLTLTLLTTTVASVASGAILLLVADGWEMRVAGALYSLSILAGGLGSSRTAFQARVRNDVTVAILTLNSLLWTGVVVLAAIFDWGLVPLAGGYLLCALSTALLQLVLAFRAGLLTLRGVRYLWTPLLRAGLPLAGAALLTVAYTRVDQVLVYELAGAAEAGLYGAVYRILDRAQFVPVAVVTTLLPMLAAAHAHDRARLRRLFQRAAEYLGLASLPLLGLTIVAPQSLVDLLFGSEFADAAPALPILMGAFVAISFGHLAINMVIVLGLQRRLAVYAGLGLALNVVLNVILIPPYGFLAAAWVTLATECVVVVLAMRAVTQAADISLASGRLARATVAAILMTLALWGLDELGASLGVLVVAAAAIYLPLVVALRALDIAELRSLLRRA
jgi:O-antigen/teichoic acid export membrane protein